ncbi:MAG: DeoR family transcriptional regulator [Chloroflexota bacterium]
MLKKQSKTKTNTRDTILHAIKERHTATIDDLAVAADVSPVTVRHHLNTLLANGKIVAETVRRSVGRPHYVYSLSEEGEELFSQKYFRLNVLLLDEMKDRFDSEVISDIFSSVAKRVVEEHRPAYESLPFEERLDYLVKILKSEGFLAKWEKVDGSYVLREYGCPYISIGQVHDEVCAFDKDLILSVLNTEFEQHSCMLRGDSCCNFTIPAPTEQQTG